VLELEAVKIMVPESEPIENVLRRFKRSVNQSGHLMDLRFREFHESSYDKRKRKGDRAKVLDKMERKNDRFERSYESEYNS